MSKSPAISDLSRLGKLVSVLAKYGFGSLLNKLGFSSSKRDLPLNNLTSNPSQTAIQLRKALEELGTTYIKFGQMLSTRSDILSKEYIDELSKLQDNSPALPFETIQEILVEALKQPLEEIFESIEKEPLGTASIAQTHRARLKDGSRVVLKVQRPNLKQVVQSDIDILTRFAKALENNIEEISYIQPTKILESFEKILLKEIDFLNEANNIRMFAERYQSRTDCIFPLPYLELTKPNILVMREIVGQKITTLSPRTPEARDVAERLLSLVFEMIFNDGRFHGDPHPGNVFITEDYKIGLLDFGSIGYFSKRQKDLLANIVIAFSLGNSELITRDILKLGHPTRRVAINELQADIESIIDEHLKGTLASIDVAEYAYHFVQTGQKYGVRIPSEFVCAIRALISVEGIIQYLYPDLDVFQTISKYSRQLFKETYTAHNFKNALLQTSLSSMGLIQSLPAHAEQIMMDVQHDGFPVKLQDNVSEPFNDAINTLATKLSISVILSALLLAAALYQNQLLINIFGVIAITWIVILIFWHKINKNIPTRFKILPVIKHIKRRRE